MFSKLNKKWSKESIIVVIATFIFFSDSIIIASNEKAIEIFFSPSDNCIQELISEIEKAESSLLIAMYNFTSKPLAQALINACQRQIEVKVCLDGTDPYHRHAKGSYLSKKGVLVKIIEGEGIMHHKFCIIDEKKVITGSFNWTTSADLRNDENLLVIRSADIAASYKDEFMRLWKGKKIDACRYTDQARAQKAYLPETIIALSFPASRMKYVGNKKSKKLHYFNCRWAKKIQPANKIQFRSTQMAFKKGYISCKSCCPDKR